jgi:hypothetical protein
VADESQKDSLTNPVLLQKGIFIHRGALGVCHCYENALELSLAVPALLMFAIAHY